MTPMSQPWCAIDPRAARWEDSELSGIPPRFLNIMRRLGRGTQVDFIHISRGRPLSNATAEITLA